MVSEIKHLLDYAPSKEMLILAEKKIAELESLKLFDSGCNLQLLLSLKVQLFLKQKKDKIKELIYTAIDITYEFFDENNFDSTFLFLEEPDLIHSLALTYAADGNLEIAISLIKKILHGLENALIDSESKEKKRTPVQLSLVNFLMEAGCYEEALEACIDGFHLSCRSDSGKYVPDFMYRQAHCLYKLGKPEDIKRLLQCAYFGFIILHKKDEAFTIIKEAKEIFNVSFELYGTDKLPIKPIVPVVKSYGKALPCTGIGDFIKNVRESLNLTQEVLCYGLCSPPALSKIEKGKSYGNIFLVETLMQRMGKHVNHYVTFFPSLDDFNLLEIRDKIVTLLVLHKYNEAEELLEDYKTLAGKDNLNKAIKKQFEFFVQATVMHGRKQRGEEYLDILHKAINSTIPGFKESKIFNYRLSYIEIVLVHQLAMYHAIQSRSEVKRHGLFIWQSLIKNINSIDFDDDEKARMYENILYSYSKHLGLAKRYEESLEIINEGESIARDFQKLSSLPKFLVNRACNMLYNGQKKESLPCFALAFYGSAIFSVYGMANNIFSTNKYVKEHFGIEMDYDIAP